MFSASGTVVAEMDFPGYWCAGFSRDGALVLQVSDGDAAGTVSLVARSAATGEIVESRDITDLDPSLQQHLASQPEDLPAGWCEVLSNVRHSRGWKGFRVDLEPATRTFVIGYKVPTGVVRHIDRKDYTEVTRHWVHVAVDG